jgi:hypothetical protein
MPRNRKAKPTKTVLIFGESEDFTAPLLRKFSSAGYWAVSEHARKDALAVARRMRPAALVVDGRTDVAAARELCRIFKSRIGVAATILVNVRDEPADEDVDVFAPSSCSPAETVGLTGNALRQIASAGAKIAGSLRLDRGNRKIFFHDEPMELTATEYDLLALLIENAGHIMSRGVLLRDVWGYPENAKTRTLDMLVSRLRTKLRDESLRLETVYHQGYRLRTDRDI